MVSRGAGRCEWAWHGEPGPKVFHAGGLRKSHVARRPLPFLQACLSGSARWDQQAAWRQGESAMGHGVPNPQGCRARPLWKGPSGPDLWLGLAPGGWLARAYGCAASRGAGRGEGAGHGVRGTKGFVTGGLRTSPGFRGPACSPALNDRRHSDGPGWQRGSRVSLVLGFRGPQSPALRHQSPWEVPIRADKGLELAPKSQAGPSKGYMDSGGAG